ncbi:hypothetical protein [Loktanella sp. M215]|uniref:hypothetical protein n=1 Tax=Loktanella sp. M215 TaxID=2675431 RepID=UPI001F414CAF|nr:hypothetical protein [Loktanella sp. M215]MCF7701782.1 hypothetical protein [Loktanella sp. M215]
MTTTGSIHLTRRQGTAGSIMILTIDFPPINAGGRAMRTALLDDVLDRAAED